MSAGLLWAFEQQPGKPSEKLVLIVLASHTGMCSAVGEYPSADSREMTGLSEKKFARAIDALLAKGYLGMARCGQMHLNIPADFGRRYDIEHPDDAPPGIFTDDRDEPVARRGHRQAPRRTRESVMLRDGGVCAYCQSGATTVDHVMPVSRGGTHDESNLVACCSTCNSSKGARTPDEWCAAGGNA